MPVLPCTTNPRLYDIVLFAKPSDRDRQAAAALCAACPAPCEQKITTEPRLDGCPQCPKPSYATYQAHVRRGEDACEASKAKRRDYDKERYAKNPRRARAPQRAYDARKRAERRLAAAGGSA